MSNWTDSIIGERMAVDQTFTDRVQASQFSNAEWDLIMTATDFEIKNADDPKAAQIIANTDAVAGIIPELETIRSQTAAMAGQPGGQNPSSNGGSSLVASIKRALGFGRNASADSDDSTEVDQAKLAAAEQLTAEYAETLQAHLEETDRFEQARTAALES